jgi:hypothetical protein
MVERPRIRARVASEDAVAGPGEEKGRSIAAARPCARPNPRYEEAVASQHDGKRARENMWVTHQNLARARGGKQYLPKPRKPRAPLAGATPKVADAAATPPEPAEE